MTRYIIGNTKEKKFISENGRVVSDRKWAKIFTEKFGTTMLSVWEGKGMKLIKVEVKTVKKFGVKEIPAEVFCDGGKVYHRKDKASEVKKAPVKKTKMVSNSEYVDGKEMTFDEDFFFRKLNDTCLKCKKECKQSALVTIIRCPSMEKI